MKQYSISPASLQQVQFQIQMGYRFRTAFAACFAIFSLQCVFVTESAAQPAKKNGVSDAEKILALRKSIEIDKRQLAKIKSALADPKSEFHILEKMLTEIREKIQATKNERKKRRAQNDLKAVAKIEQELQELEKRSSALEKDYANAAREQATLANTAIRLEQAIAQNQLAIHRILNIDEATKKENQPPVILNPPEPKTPKQDKTTKQDDPKTGNDKEAKPIDPELRKAIEESKTKKLAAQQAVDKAKSLSDRLAALRQFISGDKKLLRLHQKKVEKGQQLLADFEKNLQVKLADKNANNDEIATIRQRIAELKAMVKDAQAEKDATALRIQRNESELIALQSEQIELLQNAEQKRLEAEKAQKKVEELRNPFTVRNLKQWAIDHCPKLLLIVVVMWILHRLTRLFSHRAVRLMIRRQKRESERERKNRANTLGAVLASAASIAIFIGGTLMILDEIGIPIAALLGGAAILGLAVAFGAQNLFKDYFTGFMILMEDQYGINDIIKIGSVRGTVERITLRTTVVRDLEGVLHFFPHGTLDVVANYTHTWSRALFEVRVAYKENVNHVIEVLMQLANELREDAEYKSKILDNPRMLGVDRFEDSAVVIKFYLKTAPIQQWKVKWELNRRIKNKFAELGIEIPFPHRTVYHRHSERQMADGEPMPEHSQQEIPEESLSGH